MIQILKKRLLPIALAGALTFSFTACDVLPQVNQNAVTSMTVDEFMRKQENQNGASQKIVEIDSILGVPVAVSGDLLLTSEPEEHVAFFDRLLTT